MSTPLISVILTTYNRSDKLKRAIKSVQDQTFEDWELIVVDDASGDNTPKVVNKFIKKDPRIRYLKRNENWGCHSRPKNDGILVSETALIAYIDDDNVWLPDHLMALYKTLEKRPDLQMVYGDRWIMDEEGKLPKQIGWTTEWSPQVLQVKNYIDTGDVLMRKEVLYQLGGWDESLKKFADWNLWLRFAKAGYKAERVPLVLSEYHIHPFMAQLRHQSPVGMNGEVLPTFSPHACKIFAEKTIFPKLPDPKVAILTISWKRYDYLKRTVDSMHKTSGYDFDHYLVLNEYKEGDILPEVPPYNFKNIQFNKENLGCPKAYNQGLDMIKNSGIKYDVIVLTDNDVEFLSQDWLKNILDLFSRTTKLILSPYVEGLRDNPGGAPRTGVNVGGRQVVPRQGWIGEHYLGFVTYMGNIVQAFPVKFFDNFSFEEKTFKHGTQSFQVSQSAIAKGFIMAYMENVRIKHMDTTAGQEKKDPEYFKARLKAKQEKLTYDEKFDENSLEYKDYLQHQITERRSYYWESQQTKIIKDYIKYFEEPIIDFGCGTGESLEILELHGKKNVWGIDINKERVEIAQKKGRKVRLYDMHQTDLNDGGVNTVYSCHALEHSFDLQAVVKEMKRIARKRIILVVPLESFLDFKNNTAHYQHFEKKEDVIKLFDTWGKVTVLEEKGGQGIFLIKRNA